MTNKPMDIISRLSFLFLSILGRDALRDVSESLFDEKNRLDEEDEPINVNDIELTSGTDIMKHMRSVFITFTVIAAFFSMLDESLKTFFELEAILIGYVVFSLLTIYIGLKNNIKYICSTLVFDNRYSECISFLRRCTTAYPKFKYFQWLLLCVLFLTGDLKGYRDYYNEHSFANYKLKMKSICSMEYIVSYLNGEVIQSATNMMDSDDDSILLYTGNLVSAVSQEIIEYKEALSKVTKLIDCENNLYKSIGFLICSEVYWKMGIVEKSNYCIECAINTSPSEEVTQCIQRHLGAMK